MYKAKYKDIKINIKNNIQSDMKGQCIRKITYERFF